jgi:hypothetical protein
MLSIARKLAKSTKSRKSRKKSLLQRINKTLKEYLCRGASGILSLLYRIFLSS